MHTAEESGRYARIGLVLLLALALGALLPVAASAAVGDPILHNSLTTSSSKWTGTWGGWGVTGGKYGQFVCSTCHTRGSSNIKRIRSSIATPDTSKGSLPGSGQPIVYTRPQGTLRGVTPGTMGDDGFTPRATSNRICEICHTYNASGVNGVTSHPYTYNTGTLPDHQSSDGDDCTACHKHSAGFKAPQCDSCHGSPPIVSTLGGPNGLANSPHTTGSTSAGSHLAHVRTYGIGNCQSCHNGYTMPGLSTVPSLSNKGNITISFNVYGYTTGTYGGQTNVSYNNAAGNGNMTCSTVYCHSNGARTGTTYASPRWGYIPSAACGTCHGADANTPPVSSAHTQHSGTTSVAPYHYACSKCHPDVASRTSSTFATTITNTALHVNGAYNIAFDSSNPTGTYTGERCSNLYCHSIGNSSVTPGQLASAYSGTIYSSVSWTAGNIACNACHGKTNGTGFPDYRSGGQGVVTSNSHSKHSNSVANGGSNIGCQQCHYATTTTGTSIRTDFDPSNHVNSAVTVSFNVASNPTATFVSSSHTCQSTYCHGVNIIWGAPGPLACNSCHGANNTLQGKHATHYESATTATGLLATEWSTTTAYLYNCGVCHYNTNHAGGEVQANIQSAQVIFDPSIAGAGTYNAGSTRAGVDTGNRNWTAGAAANACQSTFCHSQGTSFTAPFSTPVYSNMSWTGSATLGCNGCHGDLTNDSGKPSYANNSLKKNSHTEHMPWNTLYSCQVCHSVVTPGWRTIGNKLLHQSKNAYNAGGQAGNWMSFAYTYAADGGTCASNACHGGRTAKWGTFSGTGVANQTWDCVTCHSVAFPKRLGGLGTIRNISGAGGDFTRASRHARNFFGQPTILKWDCVVCHQEGQHTGSPGRVDWGYHNDGVGASGGRINLRDVDNPASGWSLNNRAWTTTDYTNLDQFCLNCHDANGASGINVNATNNGLNLTNARALTPFNTMTVNASGWYTSSTNHAPTPKTRVNNLKDKFFVGAQPAGPNYVGNPSQHAVIGKRYSTVWNAWSQRAWGSTYRLLKDGRLQNVARETAVLTCADCHVIDAGPAGNAHGANTPYMMWTTNLVAMCWRCHNAGTYMAADNTIGAANGSIINHSDIDGGRGGSTYTAYGLQGGGGPAENAGMSWNCLMCHANWVGYTTATRQMTLGGIHGSWQTNASWVTTAGKPYRFTPGTHFKITPPGLNTNAWGSGGTPGCYFIGTSANATTWTNCGSHSVGGQSAGAPPRAYSRPVNY